MDEYFEEDHKNEGAKDWSIILGNLQDIKISSVSLQWNMELLVPTLAEKIFHFFAPGCAIV
jgi:hypothetical protein